MSDAKIKRLRELMTAVTQGREAVSREFTMRVPAEPDRDADLVLRWAADHIESLTSENTRLKREKCFWEAQSKVLSELIEDCEYAQCPCQPALMPLPPPPGDEQ